MASYNKSGVSSMLSDYTHLRTLPALLSVVFVIASLYQFGGISEVMITWVDYTLTSEHAMLVSIGAYALAFAYSETKALDRYEDIEKVLIFAGQGLIVGYQYIGFVTDLVNTSSNLGPVLAFLATVVAWGVAVR